MIASLADQPGDDGLGSAAGPGLGASQPWAASLAIALGANLGDPFATLVALRPLLAELLATLLEEGSQAGDLLGSRPAGWGGPGCGGGEGPESGPGALQEFPFQPPVRAPVQTPTQPSGPTDGGACSGVIRLRWSPLFRTEPVGGPAGQPAYLNGVLLVEGLAGLEPRPQQLLAGLQALEAQFGRQRLEAWGPRTLDLDLLWWGDQRLAGPALALPHPRLRERSFVLAPLAAIDPLLVPPGAGGGPALGCGALLAALLPRLREAAPERLAGRAGWPE